MKTIPDRLAEAEVKVLYHYGNYETAVNVGSLRSAEHQIEEAAKWSSIYTALDIIRKKREAEE